MKICQLVMQIMVLKINKLLLLYSQMLVADCQIVHTNLFLIMYKHCDGFQFCTIPFVMCQKKL